MCDENHSTKHSLGYKQNMLKKGFIHIYTSMLLNITLAKIPVKKCKKKERIERKKWWWNRPENVQMDVLLLF
jgi:hypothetical protein